MATHDSDNLGLMMGRTAKLMPRAKDVIEDTDIIAAIEDNGNIESVDRDGRTPLINAVTYDRFHVAEWLIKKGAPINTQDRMGFTALHAAVAGNTARCVELLLEHSANANAKNSVGATPLMMCNLGTSIEIIRLLVCGGANPFETNDFGYCAADMFSTRPDILSIFDGVK